MNKRVITRPEYRDQEPKHDHGGSRVRTGREQGPGRDHGGSRACGPGVLARTELQAARHGSTHVTTRPAAWYRHRAGDLRPAPPALRPPALRPPAPVLPAPRLRAPDPLPGPAATSPA